MGLREQMADDSAVLVDTTMHGESVVYRPKAGGAYTINAGVWRSEPQGSRIARTRTARIRVRNSADTSIGVETPDADGDTVDVVLQDGQAPVNARVTRIVSGSPLGWLLEVAG